VTQLRVARVRSEIRESQVKRQQRHRDGEGAVRQRQQPAERIVGSRFVRLVAFGDPRALLGHRGSTSAAPDVDRHISRAPVSPHSRLALDHRLSPSNASGAQHNQPRSGDAQTAHQS
jgi:hypothetical protein